MKIGRAEDPPEIIHTTTLMNRYREEACVSCAVRKRSGGLPCRWRSEIDILTMAADSPSVMITSCPHYKPENDPADLIEWL